MRDRRPYAPPEPVYRRPWSLAGLLDHAMAFLTVTIAGWWISILVEWAGIGFHWWDLPGAAHSQDVLRTELSWLKADFTAAEFTLRVIDWAYWGAQMLYHWSGLEWIVRWIVADPTLPYPGPTPLRQTLRHFGDYLLAATYVTQLVGARLAVVWLTLPVFLLMGLMGVIDGLVMRDLRRFGGGAESSFMYHHLKKMIRPMASVPIFLYLIAPWSVHPTLLFGPFTLLFGYFMQRTLSKFKKYL
ncbi:putative Integrating conjugative element protein [Candidatus Competibacter denitrificans Run_A_D11]|uniref:Integrating conjugative element protein n=1 Tax=Candidatus Competibacter denitrificans Run_A_D11 TaxID=1400863 RepID=W6M6S2_9GAMM|nr:TIGR03747 family integrating conjugative element membrane protein [Candidatus Competibacter denitrificans]CDI02329.1 putative Integrating conjugative element protein [Candidatus Competibacter denitrificans Run_A_D11]